MSKFFDTTIERRVVAAMLHNDEALEYIVQNINTEDFENKDVEYLFDIIVRFYRKYYKRITIDILTRWLDKNNPKSKTQVLLLFTEISTLPIDTYYRYYVTELKTFTAKRKLYTIHERITTGLNEDEDPDKLFTDVSRQILVSNTSSFVHRTSVFDDIDERIRLYEDHRDHPEKYRGVQYGIKEIDVLTGGMFTSQLYAIVGRSGSGKSRTIFNIGANIAKTGKSVMYCTIEMEAAIIQYMWESRETRTPLQKILRAQMTEEEELKYTQFIKDSATSKIPFYIVDIPQGCTTGTIDAEVVMFEKIHGKVPDIVLIDYANLINPVSKFRDRAEKYDYLFRELKEGARAHRTIYYTAAQLNRESVKSKEPGTEHIAFSDAISYHCDAIYRVSADKNAEAQKELVFDVVKGRYHEKVSILLCWERDINLINSYSDRIKLPKEGEESASDNPSPGGHVPENRFTFDTDQPGGDDFTAY